MSKQLAPLPLALTPPSPSTPYPFQLLKNLSKPIKDTMELAANPMVKSFLAGSFSGTCSTILFQPLDLVKTRLQSAPQGTNSGGMITIFKQILHTDNISGLWRGISPSIARTVPGVGIYFCSLHCLKTSTTETGQQPSPLQAVVLGMAARSFAGTVMIPITVVKARYESGLYNYQRISQALSAIYTKEGARGLSSGLLPTLVRDAPYSGLYFMFYTQLKQQLQALDPAGSLAGSTTNFTCGLIAGFFSSAVTHPFDVVKTRMQLSPESHRTLVSTAAVVLRFQGPSGFLIGLVPRMIRRAGMSALAWTVYEEVMRQVGLK